MSSNNLEDILGKQVRLQDKTVDLSALLQSGAEFICIYYGAHWAPPCRLFTPQLAEFYQKINGMEN